MWGFILIAFGIGVLVGQMIGSVFICVCGGFLISGVGFCILRRK